MNSDISTVTSNDVLMEDVLPFYAGKALETDLLLETYGGQGVLAFVLTSLQWKILTLPTS